MRSVADNQADFYARNAKGSAAATAGEDGRIAIGSTGPLELTAAGNFRLLLTNNTGKTLSIARLVCFCTVDAFIDFRINPTTGLPATDRTVSNAIIGKAAPSVNLKADVDTLTPLGGGTFYAATAVGAGDREPLELPPVYIPNGVVLGVNVALGASARASFTVIAAVGA